MEADRPVLVHMDLTQEDVEQIISSVAFHIKNWPGAPAADVQEQERLWKLQLLFNAAYMEIMFHKDDED